MNTRFRKVVGILIIVGIIVLLGWILSAPPNALSYFGYLRDARSSKDEVITYKCEEVTLQVTHTDTAVSGVNKGIDFKGRPPELVDVYVLQGFRGTNRIFSTTRTLQNWDVRQKYQETNQSLHDLPGNIDIAFVIDRPEYNRMRDERTRYRESRALVFDPVRTDKRDVEELARCYAQYRDELKDSFGAPISSFVILAPNQNTNQPSGTFEFINPTPIRPKGTVQAIYLD